MVFNATFNNISVLLVEVDVEVDVCWIFFFEKNPTKMKLIK
jgi:hypothetical protein